MKQLAGGNGPMQEAGQSALPTSLTQLETPKTIVTISTTPVATASAKNVGDLSTLWWIVGILLFVLILVKITKKK